MAYKTTDAFAAQFFDDNGAAAVNHTLEFFVTGTSTPASIAFDTAGNSTATSVTIGANGFPQNSGSDAEIYFDEAVTYDIVRKDSGGTAYGPTVTAFTVASSATAEAAVGVLSAAGSAANAIVADLAQPPGSLTDQLQVVVELQHAANTSTSVTFNLNSLGAKSVKRDNNAALQVGDTGGAGAKLYLSYSATNDVWILLNPYTIKATALADSTIAGDGLAIASGVLSVNVDDSTIETNADALRLKDGGITADKIAVGATEKVITSGSITAASSLEFVLSTLDTSQGVYNRYKIYLMNFLPATDDVELNYTISSDGGSTYASTAYYGAMDGRNSGGTTFTRDWSNTANGVVIGTTTASSALSNTAGEESTIIITLANMNTGTSILPYIETDGGYWSAAGAFVKMNGGGTVKSAADYDAIKFAMESGNFQASGSYVVTKLGNP